MINDEVIWQSINGSFCSFKSKVQTHNFCRNEYNVTGLCNKSACPLANSRYATIREEEGRCYLMIKTIERAHMPKKLWQKIPLPANYGAALALVSTELEHFPKFLQHRNKQRLTRIHQYIIRMRKLALRHDKPVITAVHKKVDVRENRREKKALTAAKLNTSIQNELLERLKQGTYGDIYNFPAMQYNGALDDAQGSADEEEEDEMSDVDDDEQRMEYVEGDFESDGEEGDLEDYAGDDDPDFEAPKRKEPPAALLPAKRRKPAKRVEIEYDDEEEDMETQTA
ncbi:ribosomal L28e protein family-domain-containing protein [Pelagophyceae sp. CCMP2097]|nr:ribosomal L28e protein family-domain-containing protein [Pelagophyceae sp. CCMP2097]|mmetsp:Transcript_27703/g.93079  ORF Transcript_27703/g.93079 Transcript_27703/m.93079 type:complete len:283 (-) Transcript_27703:43-891(-)